jgi:hypothetical protein
MVNRVFLGRSGGGVLIGVSKPGVDVLSAPPSAQLWRTDIEVLRYGTQGTITIGGDDSAYVYLAKSYSRSPMIFVGMVLYSGSTPVALRSPSRDFRVRFTLGENRFRIENRKSSTQAFVYLVYDNNIGSQSFKSVEKNNGNWVFE